MKCFLPILSRKKDEEKKKTPWPIKALFNLFWLAIIAWIWPWSIEPFTVLSLWTPPAEQPLIQLASWGEAAYPIFVWGVSVTLIAQIAGIYSNKNLMEKYKERISLADAEENYLKGILISTWAGVAEEIAFRWIFFLHGMIAVKIANWLFFGVLGFGIAEHIYLWIVGPIANFFTFGHMEPWLFHPAHWAIGAALIAANALFRDGHKYQGPLGFINSWFIGMFLFWCMFKFGLLGAIAIHFFYDFLIFTCVYMVTVSRRAVA
jgi:hypothetical protein